MRKIERRTWICLLIAGILAAGLAVFVVLFFKTAENGRPPPSTATSTPPPAPF